MDVAIPRDHYSQLLLAAGQDLAEASATEIATTGAFGGPGPSCAALVADAFAVEPAAATELVDAYVESLRHRCAVRDVQAPSLEAVLDGIVAVLHPRLHAPVDRAALVAHLGRTVAPQTIRFHPRHRAAVLDGSKTVTVRWREAAETGPARIAFGDEPEWLPGHVRSVARVPLADLTPAAVHAPEGTDMAAFVALLRERYYPAMPDDAVLTVVELTLDDDA